MKIEILTLRYTGSCRSAMSGLSSLARVARQSGSSGRVLLLGNDLFG